MNKAYILLLLLFFIRYLSAQDFIEPEFGKLSQKEIDMQTCSFDSIANAVVLFDIGKTKFIKGFRSFDIRFTHHKRIKIFTKQGFDSGEISIPFYVDDDNNEEKIESIEAYTYIIENGKIQKHKLDPTTVYTERINQYWKQKKFVFPNLKEGAIIEYKYILVTPFVFNLPDWEFQSNIPTIHSQYQVGMIPFYEYVRLTQGIDSLDFHKAVKSEKRYSFRGTEYKELVYTSVMKNVEGFKDETFITSKNDYIKKFDFQLAKIYHQDGTIREVMPTWAKLNRDLLASEHFGKYIKGCKRFAKKSLASIDTTNQTREEKVETLVKYVKESFYWNGYYGKTTSQTAKEFYTKKSGNIADINLFLLALLREVDINADPVILSTRDHGKLSLLYPISKRFNYVLVYVNESNFNFITDATSPLTHYLMVPTRCINDYGLIVNKDKESLWTQIQYNSLALNLKSIDIYIKPEKEICEVSATFKTNFYEAYQNRFKYNDNIVKIKKELKENFDEIFDIETQNYDKPKLPYIISFKAKKEVTMINNYILIKPFLGLTPTQNMLKQEKRDYPVDMLYPKHYQYDINLFLPPDYDVKKIPESFFLDDDLVSVILNIIKDEQNNRVQIVGEYKFKKAVYSPQNYIMLKSHMDSIVEKFNIELTLAKNAKNE